VSAWHLALHRRITTIFDEPDLQGEVFGEIYLKSAGAASVAAGAALVAPEGVAVGAAAGTLAQRAAFRITATLADPNAGFTKGFGVGITNQLVFDGQFPVPEPPGSNAFKFGLDVGNTIGAAVSSIRELGLY